LAFTSNDEDDQLLKLIDYLPLLSSKPDVRNTLKRNFKLKELYDMKETFTIYNDVDEVESMDSHLDNLTNLII